MVLPHQGIGEGEMAGVRRQSRRLATIPKSAKYIGVPESTLYEWTRHGRIAGIVRVGRRVLLDLDQVDRVDRYRRRPHGA